MEQIRSAKTSQELQPNAVLEISEKKYQLT